MSNPKYELTHIVAEKLNCFFLFFLHSINTKDSIWRNNYFLFKKIILLEKRARKDSSLSQSFDSLCENQSWQKKVSINFVSSRGER